MAQTSCGKIHRKEGRSVNVFNQFRNTLFRIMLLDHHRTARISLLIAVLLIHRIQEEPSSSNQNIKGKIACVVVDVFVKIKGGKE